MEDILAKINSFHQNSPAISVKPKAKNKEPLNSTTAHVTVVAFSRDRPYQLGQLLDSLPSSDETVVLYVDPHKKWADGYNKLIATYNDVRFVKESDFSKDIMSILRDSELMASRLNRESVVLFCVDDLLFFSPTAVNLAACARALLDSSFDIPCWSVHLKLHPGICYSHTRDAYSPPPALQAVPSSSFLLRFNLNEAGVEWKYPFDLCGSMYRTKEIVVLLQMLPAADYASPNLLESAGNIAFQRLQSGVHQQDNCEKDSLGVSVLPQYTQCMCRATPCLTVITVNKVQTDFNSVPIYDTKGGSLDELNSKSTSSIWKERYRMDYTTSSMSVHVGALHFSSPESVKAVTSAGQGVQVSLLIPIYNGECYLNETLQSLRQPQGCSFDVVFVDDGSTDLSVTKIMEFLQIDLDGTLPCESEVSGSFTSHSGIEVQCWLLLRKHQGLPLALDAGLSFLLNSAVVENRRSDVFVARLDADDILEPMRLCSQLEVLQFNESVHVVGTQAYLVKEHVSADDSPFIADGLYTHPSTVCWAMYFNCAVIHPSVMFRASIVAEFGGYSGCLNQSTATEQQTTQDEYCPVEDYRLWLHILARYPHSICNTPGVGIRLRRHNKSKSQKEKKQAFAAACGLRHVAAAKLLGETVLSATDKVALDALVDPSQLLHEEIAVVNAMALLNRMKAKYEKYFVHMSLDESRAVRMQIEYHCETLRRKVRGFALTRKLRYDTDGLAFSSMSSAIKEGIVQSVIHTLTSDSNRGDT